jgi:hypothetical protein
MRYPRSALILMAAVSLVGCQISSGILPAGPNTYTVTERVAPIAGGGMEAQRRTLSEANAHCKSQGREMMPLDLKDAGNLNNPYGPTGYSVTFRCLLPTDPEFRR